MAKSPQPALNKSPPANVKKDYYATYVVVVVVILLACSLAIYFFTHSQSKTEKKQNYQALPQLIVDNNGQVVRLQVTVQVSEKDRDWLEKNKNAVNDIFQQTGSEINPADFRTEQGREAAQTKFKDAINNQLHVDKVKAVLYTDMLVQIKDRE
jgi:flagellar basal body-associated protein FliL